MIASMTGFGRGEAEEQGYIATVELRSVNSRYCEISPRTPKSISDKESEIQRTIKDEFARGRISVSVQIEEPASEVAPYRVNAVAVKGYKDLLEEVRRAAGIEEPVRLEHILRYPDIMESIDQPEPEDDYAWIATQAALLDACKAMRAMRLQEGDALRKELEDRLNGTEEKLREVERLAPIRVVSTKERLQQRLSEVLDDGRIDPDRLEFEMTMVADKLDVREECVRLDSHLVLFREAIASGDPVGRKLNFLAQEMNREINTIGSKSNDAEMSHLVVGMKEELEKIREQVENVE
jgi:uncharacterized protein (TIGR00255 family)